MQFTVRTCKKDQGRHHKNEAQPNAAPGGISFCVACQNRNRDCFLHFHFPAPRLCDFTQRVEEKPPDPKTLSVAPNNPAFAPGVMIGCGRHDDNNQFIFDKAIIFATW
jgi:hypothetical protein